MKKIVLLALMVLPLMAGAQTKIKETAVPRSVLLSLEKTYDSYKVKTWYQAPGQYIAEVLIDGQEGRSYFTAGGDWQYSTFPVKMEECPTMLNSYFTNNYLGYRVKTLDYVEEMNGDNYYRMIITKKGISENDYELVFDTRGKLMKSNAPDPEAVKIDYYTHNNPDATDKEITKATNTETSRHRDRPRPKVDEPMVEQFAPNDEVKASFEKVVGSNKCKAGPEWVNRNGQFAVAYYTNKKKVECDAVFDINTGQSIMIGSVQSKDRYMKKKAIMSYINEKFNGERYKIEKVVDYEYNSKFRGPDGKKPAQFTYVVISQRIKGTRQLKYTRMMFDKGGNFTELLAQPLDEKDVQ
jgi:hypothetical protein